MDYLTKTNEYYSKWIGKDNILNNNFKGVKFIYSSERNKIQHGYGKQLDLYIFSQSDKIIVSYGNKLIDEIKEVQKYFESIMPIDRVLIIIKQLFGDCFNHDIKYVFNQIPNQKLNSRPLIDEEYLQYLEFFIKNNPNCENTDWIKEYFIKMVNEHLCYGLFVNNTLISCSDAPDMPYMQECVQEIGINTLEEYIGNGYATDVCITCAKEIIKNEKCPLWSTSADNIASQKLAEKVGFIKFADAITVTV
ncbi:GNAT family N-acetyltransferase [Sedimentibacter sp. zth1]|uniref:GNAT family N-acetyltransferase n=1 Tax=Sedimentibacter sp. zth1 TaxID=2816908 RepID=UPI001A912D65|nr:GNAT family protein [Sedimentibacter sp. zth1]QSX07242.1 GNAT family N-acetyltransferase [Sedimentibacter sp. zth1]